MDWIKASDKMPELYQNCLMLRFDGNYFPDVGWWNGKEWANFDFQKVKDVRYWIPIPDPPEEE